ncbi:ABC transporter substrate-binding protein [Pseudogemmobacter blasticus]|uniref:Taurine ABC transporter substrate-binding protein n=1 Tax=Fuscovulum blasticum DSM 2131 TaxID=1188250 RepID=A0A2T4J8L8_FUSBL|nr:ABC transporter substrate-binding protein [Fuscovulum blasticum]PTE14203.1 taurine ABC transporter substrate-binding protein [Fuscovulum blasticum DSM 2131]
MPRITGLAAAFAALLASPVLAQPKEITVAYFLEWPLPFEAAKVDGTFEKELGLKVNWRAFDTGVAMSAAAAAGDVQFLISQGVPPFITATSAGQDLKAVDVAVSYSENDNCVVRKDLEITKDNVQELEGKKVGVPLGTAAHYGFLKQLEHFKIDVSKLQVVDLTPPDAAAAIAQGNIDVFCGWGGSLARAKEYGNVLLSAEEKEAAGIRVFDVISTPGGFAAENPDLVAKFLKVVNDQNAAYAADPEKFVPILAKDSGLDEAVTKDQLAGFTLPTLEEKLSDKWLGGGVQAYLKGVADFFVASGNIPSALDSYDGVVDASYLEAASKL